MKGITTVAGMPGSGAGRLADTDRRKAALQRMTENAEDLGLYQEKADIFTPEQRQEITALARGITERMVLDHIEELRREFGGSLAGKKEPVSIGYIIETPLRMDDPIFVQGEPMVEGVISEVPASEEATLLGKLMGRGRVPYRFKPPRRPYSLISIWQGGDQAEPEYTFTVPPRDWEAFCCAVKGAALDEVAAEICRDGYRVRMRESEFKRLEALF